MKRRLAAFYSSGDPEQWRRILGEGLHYHHGFFMGQEDLETGACQAVRRFHRFIPRCATVLDAGCGWGGPALMLQGEKQCEVDGVTISRSQAEYCRRHGLQVRCSDLEERPPKNNYDVIFMLEALSHILDKRRLLGVFRTKATRLILSVNCVAEDFQGDRLMFSNTMHLCKRSELERDLLSAGWRIAYAANRRAQAIPSLVYWKANFDRVFAKRMPPGHLGAHYRYTESALTSIIEWCRTFPLLDIVAD